MSPFNCGVEILLFSRAFVNNFFLYFWRYKRRIIIANDTPFLIHLLIKVDIHRYSGISPLILSQILAIGLAIGFRFFESQGNFKGEGTPLNL